jgi:membrane protein DedA with SNARE-associated domain
VLSSFEHWIAVYGTGAIFVLLFLGVFGLPVPDETLLTFAGVLARTGHLHLPSVLAAAMLGSMGGITLSYVLGRTLGHGVVERYGKWMHVTVADMHRVEAWFERRTGRLLLTFGYFIPGVRHLTAVVAGSSELPASLFARYAYAGAVLWVTTFVTLGWKVGSGWETALEKAHQHLTAVAIIVAVVAAGYALVHRWWIKRRSQ